MVRTNGLLEAAHPEGEPSMAWCTARLGCWEAGRMEDSEDTVKEGLRVTSSLTLGSLYLSVRERWGY